MHLVKYTDDRQFMVVISSQATTDDMITVESIHQLVALLLETAEVLKAPYTVEEGEVQ